MKRLVASLALLAAPPVWARTAEPKKEPAADWRVSAHLFGAGFGPVTYDRQSKNSVASGLDPQLTSVGGRFGFEKPLPYGALDVHLQGRHYSDVENRTRVRLPGDATAYTEKNEIRSKGLGLGAGYVFFPTAKAAIFHPILGLDLERDDLAVRTRTADAAGAQTGDETRTSVLYAAYASAAARWRVFTWPFETGVYLQANLPVFKNVSDPVNQHRTRAGIEIGVAFYFAPGP